jgi:predicted TIM-barrel fold metal-dependent hydrolase
MIIDTHSHPFGPSGVKVPYSYPLRSRDELPPNADEAVKPLLDRHVKVMDRLGIDKRMYVPLPPQSNDLVARSIAEYPDRFLGMAYVYICEGDALKRELDEMERAVKDLGLVGFKVYNMYQGKVMGDEAFRPIFEKANELKVPIGMDCHILPRGFVSMEAAEEPEYRVSYAGLAGLRRDAHNPARFLYSDVMDGLNDLIPILFHFGSGLFFFKEWPSIQNDIRDKAFGYNWGGMPKHRWDKFYWDVTYPYPVDTPYPPCPGGKPELMPDWMLKLFIEQAGPDRVLFGTDSTFYPEVVEPRTRRQLEQIKNLDVPEEWRENLLWKNAARVFKIDVAE